MDNLFEFIELVGGALASIITILVFFKVVIFPFFVELRIQLTQDLFFRLTNSGEIFFSQIVVYSPIDIQVTDVSFELKGKKEDMQETSYNCKAERFGSVERNSIGESSVASFYLPKSSPEFILKKEESKNILIQCNIVGSKDSIETSINSVLNEYIQLGSQQSTPTKEEAEKFLEHLKQHSTDVLSNIKLESGDHKLVCKITYKYKHFFITMPKTAKSEIIINITEHALSMYKNQTSIENFLRDHISVLDPKNRHLKIRYPECGIN